MGLFHVKEVQVSFSKSADCLQQGDGASQGSMDFRQSSTTNEFHQSIKINPEI